MGQWEKNRARGRKRQELKLRAIAHMGGHCAICKYDNPVGLQFHHVDPHRKDFEISTSLSWDRIVVELGKCVLVCANCHLEIHAGYHPGFILLEPDFSEYYYDEESSFESIEDVVLEP